MRARRKCSAEYKREAVAVFEFWDEVSSKRQDFVGLHHRLREPAHGSDFDALH